MTKDKALEKAREVLAEFDMAYDTCYWHALPTEQQTAIAEALLAAHVGMRRLVDAELEALRAQMAVLACDMRNGLQRVSKELQVEVAWVGPLPAISAALAIIDALLEHPGLLSTAAQSAREWLEAEKRKAVDLDRLAQQIKRLARGRTEDDR